MKVLVVEDDKKIAAALRRGLVAEGFVVDVSLDGLDGIWRATEQRYDVVILDLLLPGKNGFQICQELRDAGNWSPILILPGKNGFQICQELRDAGNWSPILILTAKDGELDQTEALDTGADAYLTKPFSFPVLISHVRALLRRSVDATSGPLTVQDLTVDPERRRCWRSGVEVTLTTREFAGFERPLGS